FDRAFLDRLAELVRPLGPACDLGCGPAHVARYLRGHGLSVVGVDLSREMLLNARRLNPGMELLQGSMLALPLADASLGGIAAFCSVIHVPRVELPFAFAEIRRALRPGGVLALAFHFGEGDVHTVEWWGHKVALDFYFFARAEIERQLTMAQFHISESVEREPYAEVEHPTRRAYILARTPPAPIGEAV